jgi:hypothetical protein
MLMLMASFIITPTLGFAVEVRRGWTWIFGVYHQTHPLAERYSSRIKHSKVDSVTDLRDLAR